MTTGINIELIRQLPLALRIELEENLLRKDFTQQELASIQKRLISEFGEHKEQGKRTDLGDGTCTELSVQVVPIRRENVTEKVAKIFGESERTVRNRLEVVEAAEKEPKKFGPLVEEMDKTQRVGGVYRKLKVQRQIEAIKKEPKPLPTGPFPVIVVDPAWAWECDGPVASLRFCEKRGRGVYPRMTTEQIMELPVKSLAAEDCVLWLWTPNSHLPEAFKVLEAWGFQYRTLLTWVKDRFGMGYSLRGMTEQCLLGVRGRPVLTLTNQTTALFARVRQHSRKPEEFYKLVEGLCPGSKLEMFSRHEREGWVSYGDETTRFSRKPGAELA